MKKTEYNAWLKRFIRKRVHINAQVEDIYSEAIFKMWKNTRNFKFRNDNSFYAYAKRCALSAISEYFRKERMIERVNSKENECLFNSPSRNHEKEYELSAEIGIFMKSLEKLKSIYKKILILTLFQSMKHYEIAKTLRLSRAMVSSCLFRMRKKFENIHLNKAH